MPSARQVRPLYEVASLLSVERFRWEGMSTSQRPHKPMSDVDRPGSPEHAARGTLLGVTELPGIPESVARARAFVRDVLGPAHLVLDEAVLLVSELVTNSVTHSDSRGDGQVTLAVSQCGEMIHVEVVDAGSEAEPRVREDPSAEDGRGLFLVDAISSRWGAHRDEGGRVVWFVLRAGGQ